MRMISIATCFLAISVASILASPLARKTPSICANNSPHFVAHPTSRSKYYACTNGIATLGKCSNGQVFFPRQQICSWSDDEDDSEETVSEDFRR